MPFYPGPLRAAAVVAALTLTWSTVALATPDGDQLTIARQLFDQGRELMTRGEYAQACSKFQDSQRLDPGGGTLLNLALCNELSGKTATAWVQFRDALRWARKDGRQDRIRVAEEHIAALVARLSRLRVIVPDTVRVPGLQILRDEIILGRSAWAEALAIDPGPHVVRVSAPGKIAYTRTVRVGPFADVKTIRLQPLRDAPAPVRRELSAASKKQSMDIQRWSALSVGALGIAITSIGGFFGIRAMDRDRAADALCNDTRCSPEGISKARDASDDAFVSTVLISTGAVLVGTGTYLFFTTPRKHSETANEKRMVVSGIAGSF